MHRRSSGKNGKIIVPVFVKYGLIAYVVIVTIYQSFSAMEQYGDRAPRLPLYGIYNVEQFIINNDTVPLLATDTLRRRKLIMRYPGFAFEKRKNDSTLKYAFKPDTTTRKIVMFQYKDTTQKLTFSYSFPQRMFYCLREYWTMIPQ